MGVLAPGFLLGALAVGLPLYLHLLRRHTSTPLPFSSLMLFEPQQKSSMRRRRLRYFLLLALRLALLLALCLAFADPYVNRAALGASADKRVVLAVDDSLSMRAGTRLADAKRAALAVLDSLRSGDEAQVLALDSQVRALTQPTRNAKELRAAIGRLEPTDARGNFGLLAGAMRGAAEHWRGPIELHLFSDMQQTNMPPDFTELALPAAVRLELHPLGGTPLPNWTVESVTVPARVADPRKEHVEGVIAGFGTPGAVRTVELLVEGRTVATRQVMVPPGGRGTVAFDLPLLPYGFTRCALRIDAADVLRADDEYRFSIERAEPRRGLFVRESGDTRSGLYFGAALSAAAETGIVLDIASVDRLAQIDPKRYAFVIVADLANTPTAFGERLQQYVRDGGSVLVAIGTASAQQSHVPIFGDDILATHYYSRDAARFVPVGDVDASYPLAGTAQEWSGVKFYYAAALDAANAHVALRLADATPLLIEKAVGAGRVVYFASGFDNLTNDLPLHPGFVAFVDRIVRYLSGSESRSAARAVGDLIALRTARDHAGSVEVIDPEGQRPLGLAEAATAQTFRLASAGFYQVRFADGRRDLIAANPERTESVLAAAPDDVLALWRGRAGEQTRTSAADAGPAGGPLLPHRFWWYAMVAVLIAALAESLVASRYLGTSRETA
jgi:hypothetical protein